MRYIDYQEKSVRGTFGFPIQLYYVDYTHPQYEMPLHWHLECELILVLKGHFDLSVNGNAHTLHAGESIFVPGGFIHGGSPHDCIYECVVFQMEDFLSQSVQCREAYANALEAGLIREMCYTRENKEGEIIDNIFECMEKESYGYTFTTTGLLWQLAGLIMKTHCQRRADSACKKRADKARAFKNQKRLFAAAYAERACGNGAPESPISLPRIQAGYGQNADRLFKLLSHRMRRRKALLY